VNANAQNRTVTGKVSDSNGTPLAGATISPVGSGAAVVSGPNGQFSISLPASTTQLTISYSGYATQTVVVSGNSVDVKMIASASTLSDVVVIGYGTSRKKDLTGSVASVTSKDFVKGALTTPEQLIAGKVAGVAIYL